MCVCRNFKAVPMTEDHKPTREDEAKRIRDAGGFVINSRVMGELAVSRAFGDAEFKKGIQVRRSAAERTPMELPLPPSHTLTHPSLRASSTRRASRWLRPPAAARRRRTGTMTRKERIGTSP